MNREKEERLNSFDCINVKTGTENSVRHSKGNIVPIAAYPHGAAAFSVQTSEKDGNWFYNPRHNSFEGLRLTHCASTKLGDYGQLLIMPQTGRLAVTADERWSSYRESEFMPNRIAGYLDRYRTSYELVPSMHGAFMRFSFDEKSKARRILLLGQGGEVQFADCGDCIRGYTTAGSRQTQLDDFKEYFHITLDCPFKLECFKGGAAIEVDAYTVTVKLAASFISYEQARVAWLTELSDRGMEAAAVDCRKVWEFYLNRVRITVGNDIQRERKSKFYTCMYRALLVPRCFYETSARFGSVHLNFKDGSVGEGALYTGSSLWAESRTLFPLLSVIAPEVNRNICNGMDKMYRETGRLPRCPMPDDMNRTTGMPAEIIICDSIVKGIITKDKRDAALGMLLKSASRSEGDYRSRRTAAAEFARYGYVPYDISDGSVTETIEYALGDYCMRKAAEYLKMPNFGEVGNGKYGYRKLYDFEKGYLRAADGYGRFRSGFISDEWNTDYVDSNAEQAVFAPCHDVEGLDALMEGKLKRRLDEFFSSKPSFTVGAYGVETPAMTENIDGLGRWTLASPEFYHIPYIYAELGDGIRTEEIVRKAVDEAFTNEEYPSDENCGALSAWFMFACIGLYPFCPARGDYLITHPLFDSVEILLESGKTAVLTAEGKYGKTVSHRELLDGIFDVRKKSSK